MLFAYNYFGCLKQRGSPWSWVQTPNWAINVCITQWSEWGSYDANKIPFIEGFHMKKIIARSTCCYRCLHPFWDYYGGSFLSRNSTVSKTFWKRSSRKESVYTWCINKIKVFWYSLIALISNLKLSVKSSTPINLDNIKWFLIFHYILNILFEEGHSEEENTQVVAPILL